MVFLFDNNEKKESRESHAAFTEFPGTFDEDFFISFH